MKRTMPRQISSDITAFYELRQEGRLGSEHVGAFIISLINRMYDWLSNGNALNSQEIDELRGHLIEIAGADDAYRQHICYKGLLDLILQRCSRSGSDLSTPSWSRAIAC